MRTYPLEIQVKDRILIVAPHPDDECIGVGGLIALYPRQCDVVVMTDGRYGNPLISPKQMQRIRAQEFESAMEFAGVGHFFMYGIEDGKLIMYKQCLAQVDFSCYSFVFLPNPDDNHSDHTAAYEYAMEAIKKQRITNIRVFQYEVHKPLADVTSHLDISNVIDKKQHLLGLYASQMRIHPYEKQMKSLAGYRGYQNEEAGKYLEVYREIKITDNNMVFTGTEVELAKYKQFTDILLKWVKIKNYSEGLAEYLLSMGYSNIAIYGYGPIGKLLYQELIKSDCKVEYIIDKNEKLKQEGICIFHETKNLRKVDIVVVTAMLYFEEISKELWDNNKLQSVSIEDIIRNVERRFI